MKRLSKIVKSSGSRSHKWRYIIASGFLVLLISTALVFIYFTQEELPDSDSERIIREVVAKQLRKERKNPTDPNKLTDEDFKKIEKFLLLNDLGMLTIGSLELTDIKILEKFTNLRELLAFDVKFPESSIPKWMKYLAKLGVINLDSRFSIDLSPLKNLIYLQKLTLDHIPISSLEPIKGLTNLRTLSLTSTHVSDIKPIQGLTNLEILKISDKTHIYDLESLKELKNLKTLSFSSTQISDINPIKGLINLEDINLRSTQIFSLEPLKGLTNLKTLTLTDTQVSDLEPLKKLTNLQYINLRNCVNITNEQVEDLQKALPNLKIER